MLRWIVDVSLSLHFAAATFWWWLSPKGFPFATPQCWTNSVLPYIAMGMSVVGLAAMHRGNGSLAAVIIACFSAAWLAAAIAGRIVFPVSLAGAWLLLLLVATAGAVLFAGLIQGVPREATRWMLASLVGTAIGLLVVLGQIAPPVTTIPAEPSTNAADTVDDLDRTVPAQVALSDGIRFFPGFAQLEGGAGGVGFECRPLLEFHSTSPDRFWSLFNRQRPREPRLVGTTGGPPSQTFLYDNGATITFAPPRAGELVAATATTPIAADIYSHLNTFFFVRFNAGVAPALTFSPCGNSPFEVHPADYPFGRPARFAFLDADGTFRVCEAASGEKGPFRTLGTGHLQRGEPLAIGIQVDRKSIASFVLKDWSSQLSTALSPTAGWGVPVNAIEFQLVDNDSDHYVDIWITLAGTSVGRGFETVGHRAGRYRNRFTISRGLDDDQ